MTLKVLLPSQARPMLARTLELSPPAVDDIAQRAVVLADRRPSGRPVRAPQPAPPAQLLSDAMLRIVVLDSIGGRLGTESRA